MDDLERLVNREVLDNGAAFAQSGIADSASGAVADKMGDILVHVGPVIAEADAMKCMVEIEMAANGVSMKSNEDHVLEF
jgi:hypothetical protein